MAIDMNNVNLRRCGLCLWNNYAGLGFILEPAPLPPHIVQLVESNSPAVAAGLRIRDVILAVNDKNMRESSYDDLKYTIKKARDYDGRIDLLVIDQDFYELFKEKNQSINFRFAKTIETPSTMPIDYQNFPKHQPRTCEIHLNRRATSFGFQTVNPLTDVGILIQEVYPNSPAAKTLLRKCDRIIEIDDEFIDDISSTAILEKLRTAKEKRYVKLYVVDTTTYDFFQSNNIQLSSKEYRQTRVVEKDSTNLCINEDQSLRESKTYHLPSTWETSNEQKIRFRLSRKTDEYRSIVSNFNEAMKENYTQIIKIERIQNERWYMQYLAHKKEFKKRLQNNTERILYHGCPVQAAHSIIEDCFNRSFIGVHGTAYGYGVYFSSKASYSHMYTRPNINGERCMFIARVLIGKTTRGNSSMKTRPLGFDSTTDEDHIFVIYHDAQAYAEYLITYK
ncbi:unnamed protein product [Rotaria sp. Silwood1]|nr:unnamed protein product [Rotaria sp. Silwood1]CAF1544227.1 unnamed protein product [Rotaria sp. Silwood1]